MSSLAPPKHPEHRDDAQHEISTAVPCGSGLHCRILDQGAQDRAKLMGLSFVGLAAISLCLHETNNKRERDNRGAGLFLGFRSNNRYVSSVWRV